MGIKKKLELGFVIFLGVMFVDMLGRFIKNVYYLVKISPNMMELEVLPLILFFNVYYLNTIALVICAGFLLLYLKKSKGGKK